MILQKNVCTQIAYKSKYNKFCALAAPTLDYGRARNQLLCDDASSAEHCPAAMVELHGLVFFRLLWIIGRQAKWVEAVVKFLFAIIVGQCGSKFMPRGHNPECRPEILRCRLREVTCHRGHKWTLIPIVEDRVEFVRPM